MGGVLCEIAYECVVCPLEVPECDSVCNDCVVTGDTCAVCASAVCADEDGNADPQICDDSISGVDTCADWVGSYGCEVWWSSVCANTPFPDPDGLVTDGQVQDACPDYCDTTD